MWLNGGVLWSCQLFSRTLTWTTSQLSITPPIYNISTIRVKMSQQVNDINSPSTKPLLVEEIELLVPKEPLRSLSPSPPTSCTHNTEQVLLLQAIHDQLASQNTPLQFIGNAVLQTVFVTIAFLFGLYSIFSWHASITANVSAQQANQIALISLCLFNNNVRTSPTIM